MDGAGPSEELQEVEEELRKSKGDGKEQEEDGDDCDIVGARGGGTEAEGDVEKGNSSSGGSKLSKQNIAAENLKVFTQAFTLTFLAEWGEYYCACTMFSISDQ